MPIFDFECKECDIRDERLVRRAEVDTQTCTSCGKIVPRVEEISNTSFALKGIWYKTHKRY